jgi:kinesin family protein 11
MKGNAESQQEHTDYLHKEFSGLTSNLRSLADTTERDISAAATTVDTMLSQHESTSGQQEGSVQTIRAELDSELGSLKQRTKSHAEDHCKELQAASTALSTHQQQTESDMEAHVSEMQESCSVLHSSLSSLASGGVAQWWEDTATLSSAIAQFAESQRAGVAAAGERVSRYVSQEIAVDVPTGKTPQRRNFSYPPSLAQTRPHSELLRDFRPTVSLPPLPESDSEEEREEVSGVGEVVPSFDLSEESSEVESLETTTTSVNSSVSSWTVDQDRKENTTASRSTPAFSKITAKKKYITGSKSTGAKNRPLTVKN